MKVWLALAALLLASCSVSETHIRSRVVKLGGKKGVCSGTQVRLPSGKEAILTAAHCEVLKDETNSIQVKLDDRRSIPRRIIEVSQDTDLMLLEGLDNLSGLSVSSKEPKQQDYLRAFTHGAGLETFKSIGELVQTDIIEVPVFVIDSDEAKAECNAASKYKESFISIFGAKFPVCVLSIPSYISVMTIMGGSSGGGVFNDSGELVGVVFAGGDAIAAIVTLPDIKAFLAPY